VLVEPTATGYRLRMTTKKGDLQEMIAMGFSILIMALVLLVVRGVSGTADAAASVFLGLAGMLTLGVSLGRQPFWARKRARQMDEIAAEVAELTALPPPDPERSGEPARPDAGGWRR
jgi:hypothetical protein